MEDENTPLLNEETARLLGVTKHQVHSTGTKYDTAVCHSSVKCKDVTSSTSTLDSTINYSHGFGAEDKRSYHSTSDFQTFIHLVKGNLGTGLLALPLAISKAGYILGPVLLVLLGVMAIHSMILLVKCCQALCKRLNRTTLDYGEVVEEAFKQLKFGVRVSKVAKAVINILLVATQFGFCCVYFVFWGANLKQIFDACGVELHTRVWMVIMLPIITVFTWIKNLDRLAPLSFVANVGLVFGLGSIVYYTIYQIADKKAAVFHDSDVHSAIVSMNGLPIFFGTALFTYEAIGMVLPVENKMKKPEHFSVVMATSMGIVTVIYVIIGTLGYLAFGSKIQDSITLSLPADKHPHSIPYHITKLLFCYSIFVTFLLCFYVPMDFLEPPLLRRLGIDKTKPTKKALFHILFRSSIVAITVGFALSIPQLHLFISLIGAFASSLLAIVFPPILEIMVFSKEPEPCWQKALWIIKSLVILSVGLLGFFTGTFTSAQAIVKYLTETVHNR